MHADPLESRLLRYFNFEQPTYILRDRRTKPSMFSEYDHFLKMGEIVVRIPLTSKDNPHDDLNALFAKIFRRECGVKPSRIEQHERVLNSTQYLDVHFSKNQVAQLETGDATWEDTRYAQALQAAQRPLGEGTRQAIMLHDENIPDGPACYTCKRRDIASDADVAVRKIALAVSKITEAARRQRETPDMQRTV